MFASVWFHMIRHSLIGISLRLRIADLPPCGRRERETIGGKLPTVLYVRVSSSYHGKVVLKITAVLLKNSTALTCRKSMFFSKKCLISIPIRTLCGLCVSAIVVVCCRCVLHRLCSTTCMRPCIEPLGIHARRPCRGWVLGCRPHQARTLAVSRTQSLHDAATVCDWQPALGLRPKQGCFGCLPKVLHDAKPTEQATLNPHFKKLYSFLTDWTVLLKNSTAFHFA